MKAIFACAKWKQRERDRERKATSKIRNYVWLVAGRCCEHRPSFPTVARRHVNGNLIIFINVMRCFHCLSFNVISLVSQHFSIEPFSSSLSLSLFLTQKSQLTSWICFLLSVLKFFGALTASPLWRRRSMHLTLWSFKVFSLESNHDYFSAHSRSISLSIKIQWDSR